MKFVRGALSRDRLDLDWLHPVPPDRGFETSAAGPLPLAEALDELWREDERPLLILRECRLCEGSDMPLLRRTLNNERTRLLANWFRVVRLPAHVIDNSHPFHNVFAGFGFGADLPHFFLLAHPLARPLPFTGSQTQQQLWQGLHTVLRERYQLDPVKALKRWQRLLDQFDAIEARQESWRDQLAEARAKQGPKSSRARQLRQRLEQGEAQMGVLLEREQRIRNLILLPFPK